MATTYTLSDTTYDGTYTFGAGTWANTDTVVSTTTWGVLFFGGLTWDHTLLSAATLSIAPVAFIDPASYAIDVVIAKDYGAPTAARVPTMTRSQVGVLTTAATGTGDAYLSLDLKVASSVTNGGVVFTWTPTGAYTALGTANSTAFGLVNGAWTKHERDPADNTLFLGRGVTFVIRLLSSSGVLQVGDVSTATPAKLIYTATASNTGLTGTKYIRDWDRGRASGVIECPKTGWDIPADEAVRDGYTGQLVAPEAWDPPEPRARTAHPATLSPRRRG